MAPRMRQGSPCTESPCGWTGWRQQVGGRMLGSLLRISKWYNFQSCQSSDSFPERSKVFFQTCHLFVQSSGAGEKEQELF